MRHQRKTWEQQQSLKDGGSGGVVWIAQDLCCNTAPWWSVEIKGRVTLMDNPGVWLRLTHSWLSRISLTSVLHRLNHLRANIEDVGCREARFRPSEAHLPPPYVLLV